MLKRNALRYPVAYWSVALLFTSFVVSLAQAKEPVKIIGHRGGVVDEHHPENSAGAAKEAINRGYWMLEIDLDETKDHHIVVHHMSFRDFGVPKLPSDLTMDEISKLTSPADQSHPLEFGELAALCKGKIQLMIDTKQSGHSQAYYDSMEQTLKKNGLLKNALFIGTAETRDHFKGKALISLNEAEVSKKLDAGEKLSKTYFLFEHGTTLNEKGMELAKRAGIPVVVSINEYHYAGKPDPTAAAHTDVERARKLGVTYFQIDSPYDIWLR
jgi:glycerophosphoryl diester phosphodiesterase